MNRIFLEFLVSGCITIIGIAIFIRYWRASNHPDSEEKFNYQNAKGSLLLILVGLVCFGISMSDLLN